MKYKIVTGYWMDITGRAYCGVSGARKDRYLGSIISHCRNFDCEVVCYTHEISKFELEAIKTSHELTNLTIKVVELHDIKYSEQIRSVESNKTHDELQNLNGRPPEVMWGKFDVLLRECSDDLDFIFWMDAGLQSNQVFPYMYSPEISSDVKSHAQLPPELFAVPFKQYDFGRVFNHKIMEKLATSSLNKVTLLVGTVPQCTYYPLGDYSPNNSYPNRANYPIAGFFGGGVNKVIEFCNRFTDGANLYTNNNVLDFEQSVMKYAMDMMKLEDLNLYWFDSHFMLERYHYESWTPETGDNKPLYIVWEDILNEQ
jgi:hypothetical protein